MNEEQKNEEINNKNDTETANDKEANAEDEVTDEILEDALNENSDSKVKVVVEHVKESKSGFDRFLSVLLVILIGFVGYFAGIITERVNSNNLQSLKMRKVSDLIEKNYYFTSLIDENKAFENSLSTYVASFGDQFTYYLDEDYLKTFNESMTGNYVGIGVSVTTDDKGYVTVTQCFKGGSAYEGGIVPGDKIVKVAGENMVGVELGEVVAKIKGKEGEKIEITFLSADGKEKNVELARKAVSVETVESKMLKDDIAYVNISSFDATTDKEFAQNMKILEKNNPKGLIIDLRNNGGGLLDTVVNVADYLMPESTIVSIKYRNEKDKVYKSDKKCVDVPIAVLINGNTASAAELLAGGLKVNNKAILVGEKSFGKGVVGTQFNVDSKTAMVITTGEYFLPDGTNIHKKGIEPDVKVSVDQKKTNIYLLDENNDIQLKQAVEELKK